MKVLFQSYPTCCQNKAGGVQTRIRKIYSLLKERNVKVDYFSTFETDLRNYDVLHIFMLGFENRGLVRCAKQLGLKVVLSSIVGIGEGKKLRISSLLNKLGIPTLYKYNLEILQMVDSIIVESQKESDYIQKYYKINSEKIYIIPNGIDVPDLSAINSERIENLPKDKYILQIGRFDANKNQINVIKAVKGTDLNIVFIGGADETDSSDYFNKCKKEAEGCSNITFMGWLSHVDSRFVSALNHAHALILPSYFETFGLVALEGAIVGAEVCLSNTLPLNDFDIFDKSLSFSPSSIEDIRNTLYEVIKRPRTTILQKKVESYFSWDRIINMHLDIYN